MMSFFIAALVFLLLDGIWLGYIAKSFYTENIGHLLRLNDGVLQPIWPAAIIVYIALISGLVLFVLPKAKSCLKKASIWGAFYGFVTYATYDFTNLALIKNWPLHISVIDTCWGITLCSLTSAITVFAKNRIGVRHH